MSARPAGTARACARGGQHAQLAALDERQVVAGQREARGDLAGHHVVDGRQRAAIRHVAQVQSRVDAEQCADEMRRRSRARGTVVCLFRVGLRPRNVVLHRAHAGRHGGTNGETECHVGGRGDRREVRRRVAELRVDVRIRRQRRCLRQRQHTAIGRRGLQQLQRDAPASAGTVVHHRAAARERGTGELLADAPGHLVAHAAGWEAVENLAC